MLKDSSADQDDAGSEGPPARPARVTPVPLQRAAACLPRTSQSCQGGDVFWIDSCGAATELAERCEGRACSGDHCVPDDEVESHCGAITAYGICDGDIAKACVANAIVSIDCTQKHARCVTTSEGALCLPRDDKRACSAGDASTCVGRRLHQCVDGRWTTLDCAARNASCQATSEGAACVSLSGRAPARVEVEICDGHDNDHDGLVDEDGVCDDVDLVAFVPSGAKLDNLAERMQNELTILNRVYRPRVFKWARTVEVPDKYRVFDPAQLEATASQLGQVESQAYLSHVAASQPNTPMPDSSGLGFYIPVLYVEELKLEPPKGGISTLPNERCGGVRISDAPGLPSGLVVLAEGRQPETLAHEIGHYLGLCHTHEELTRFAIANRTELECKASGDGICDTPWDPGPTQCQREPHCILSCPSVAARPDVSNIMSYYLGCRRTLTDEQLAETDKNLSLRRAWFRCQNPHDCPCQPAAAKSCPAEMSCHPGDQEGGSWFCELDGPGLPGTACRNATQCSQGSFCLRRSDASSPYGRCTRPCTLAPSCTCADVGLPFQICGEDLRGGAP